MNNDLDEIVSFSNLLNQVYSVINCLNDERYTKDMAVADLTELARSIHQEIIGRSF